MASAEQFDVAIIGAGIVGLATAFQTNCRNPSLKICVIDKESSVASHQTGHNSGVLHSGIYYKPGSLKATNCREGKKAMEAFCHEHEIEHEICGKVIVAVEESELSSLNNIFERGQQNDVRCEMIDQARLAELEPHTNGIQAIHVPEAGIVNYRSVCEKLAELVSDRGNELRLGSAVRSAEKSNDGVVIQTTSDEIQTKLVVNCAGLHCDRVSKLLSQKPATKIVPFRGEYFQLIESRKHLCKNLIYPVPDPKFPFLGVHFTRMIDGSVECGPNAVLAFAREGYRKSNINLRDLAESLTYPGFIRLASRHWRMGCGEMWRSVSKQAFVKALKRLMPDIEAKDLVPAPAGVRAQAVNRNGQLVDDFLIDENELLLSVLNAPSPAATASLNIGKLVAEKICNRF